jgi:nucleotide-binding universal stress UspA family protein
MKIVIGTDLSENSLDAARQGFAMAERMHREDDPAEVYVAYVEGQGTWYPQVGTTTILDDADNRRRMEAQVHEFLEEHLGEELEGKLDYELVLEEGRASKELPEIVDRLAADWLVVGQSGQGALARLVAGSTVEKLSHRPPCNLAIAHSRGVDWASRPKILVGIDFSEASEKALNLAIDLAEQANARLHILHVVYPPGPIALPDGLVGYAGGEYQEVSAVRERARGEMEVLVEKRQTRLDDIDWTSEVVTGYPTREIVGYAEDNDIDAIVVGTVGRSAMDDFLLGSVASGVVKHMPCTVLLTPPAH